MKEPTHIIRLNISLDPERRAALLDSLRRIGRETPFSLGAIRDHLADRARTLTDREGEEGTAHD